MVAQVGPLTYPALMQVIAAIHLSFVQHVFSTWILQTTLLQDILRDEGLGHAKHGRDWDHLGRAGLDGLSSTCLRANIFRHVDAQTVLLALASPSMA